MTAQLLFARKRAQPGIQVAVAFLCTQVKVPNVDDYKNLTCVIKYLRGTIHLQMMIGWDKTVTLTQWVDAAFLVHKDMQIHMGASLTMGIGSVISLYLKQKINTKNLSKAELVGVDDAMNFVVWTKIYFNFQTHYYPEDSPTKVLGSKNVILQDNTSTIQLERC